MKIVAAPCKSNEKEATRLREFAKKNTSGCLVCWHNSEAVNGLSKDAKSALVIRAKNSSLTFHSFLIFLVILAQFLKKQMPFYLFFNGFKFLALFLFDFLLLALKAHSKKSNTTFGNWKSFKNDRKVFLFHVKNLFRSQGI